MNRKALQTIFCCVLLSSNMLTDAYGLSQQGGTKNKNKDAANSRASFTITQLKPETTVVHDNKNVNDKTVSKTKPPVKDMVHETVKSGSKLALEINELYRMHQQLTKEIKQTPNDARQLQLLDHIKKQIQVRQLKNKQQQQIQQQQQQQQQKNQIRNKNAPEQYKHVSKTRKVQLFNPKETLTSGSLQNIGQRNMTQGHLQQVAVSHKQATQPYDGINQKQHRTKTNEILQQQMRQQTNNIVLENQMIIPQGARQIAYPQNIIRRPIIVNTHQSMGPVAHQIPSQQTGILVPVSALSSQHILNGPKLIQDKILLVNSMLNDNTLHVVSSAGLSKSASTKQSPKPLPTTTKTTPSTTTTLLPSTTVTAPPPTTTSVPETTTPLDMETLKQDLLQRTMKKQDLEIRKLQLEIRALQREERNNLPEMEIDDGPQRRRGRFGRRLQMPPFIR